MKTISRANFARLMAETAYDMPTTKKGDTIDHDEKSNKWMEASDVLASIGQPFATCTVDDDKLEDGYKVVHLITIRDIPWQIADVIREAMAELQVKFGKVTS